MMLHEEVLTRVNSTEMTGMDTPHSTREQMQGFLHALGNIGISGLKDDGCSNIYKDVLAYELNGWSFDLACEVSSVWSRLAVASPSGQWFCPGAISIAWSRSLCDSAAGRGPKSTIGEFSSMIGEIVAVFSR
jgi:hypothetical protein